MAMFKSAMRSQLMLKKHAQELLPDVNDVILDLKQSSVPAPAQCHGASECLRSSCVRSHV